MVSSWLFLWLKFGIGSFVWLLNVRYINEELCKDNGNVALLPPQWAKPVAKRICPNPKISSEDGSFYKLFCCGSGSSAQSAIPRTITEPEKPATREAAPEVPKTLAVDSQKLAAEPPRPAADLQNPLLTQQTVVLIHIRDTLWKTFTITRHGDTS